MDRVIESNLLVTMVVDGRRGPAVRDQLRAWLATGDRLHAPRLLRYEIANAVTRLLAAGATTEDAAREAWADAVRVPVKLHELVNGSRVIAIARELSRKIAYDAAYVALAEELEAEVWTLLNDTLGGGGGGGWRQRAW